MRSALKRIEAEGSFSAKPLQTALKRVESEREKWDLVVISSQILQSAERLTVSFNIRSLESIHLACALQCQFRLKRRLPFVTAGLPQKDAAAKLGLEIIAAE